MTQKLYRSSVEDRVHILADKYNNDTHEAFLRLIFYLVTGLGYDDLDSEDMIDGHGEYQIDVLHIDTSNQEQAIVTILQVTFSETLSSNKLIRLHTGLDYLLTRSRDEYSKISNSKLKNKIQEFRDLRGEILSSNIKLQCYYACLGDPQKATGEFPDQIQRIISDYSDGFREFIFKALGPDEIFELLNDREKKGVKADDRLKIVYDKNKASLLEHFIEDVSGVICTVECEEIARIVNSHPTVFDDNLRRFLGFGGAVNSAIKESCAGEADSQLFWFLNNGITIVCDHLETNKDVDTPFIDIKNIRIVNGCQTATAIARTKRDGKLQPNTKVLVRVFKTKSPSLASKLVVTTNTQNKITSRDLHAQDQIQEHIQVEFEKRFGIHYERMPNEFTDTGDQRQVISNQKIGQAYMAVVLKRPGDARSRQYKIWAEHDRVFSENVYPETYLLVYRIVEKCTQYRKELIARTPEVEISRTILANGVYHLARATSFLWREGDDWNNLESIRQQLQKMQDESNLLKSHFDNALKILVKIFKDNEEFFQDPGVALKSNDLETKLEKKLYMKLAKAR